MDTQLLKRLKKSGWFPDEVDQGFKNNMNKEIQQQLAAPVTASNRQQLTAHQLTSTFSRLPTHHQNLKVYYLQFVQKSNCGISQALSSLFPHSSESATDLPCRSDDRGHTAQGSYRSAACHLLNAPPSETEPLICRNFGCLIPFVLASRCPHSHEGKGIDE